MEGDELGERAEELVILRLGCERLGFAARDVPDCDAVIVAAGDEDETAVARCECRGEDQASVGLPTGQAFKALVPFLRAC